MQRSSSENRGRPHTNTRSPARDPRIRNKTSSTHGLNHDADAGRGGATDNRDSLRGRNDTPSTSTPQSTTSRLDNALSVLNDPPELRKTFSRHSEALLEVYFLSRKQKHLRRECEHAQSEYDKVKKTRDKFPAVVEQSEQRKTDLENEYNTVRQEETNARAAEEISAATFVGLWLEAIKAKDEVIKEQEDRYNALAEQMAAMQRELQDMRFQQAKAFAQPPQISDETSSRIQRLEAFYTQQQSDNTSFRTLDDKLKTLKRNMEDLRADYTKSNEDSRRQIGELRRTIDKESIQAASTLKSEVQALRQRIESLEHSLSPIKSHLQELKDQRTAEKEQLQQIQEASKVQGLAFDNIERLRRSVHLKVEAMSEDIKDGISTVKADLRSINSEVSDLRGGLSKLTASLETSTNAGVPISTALETEIGSLKRIDQEQSERVAALDTSVEEIAEKVGLLEENLNLLAADPPSTAVMEDLGALRSQLAKGDKDWKSLEEKVNRETELIKERLTNITTTRQGAELAALSKEVNALEGQVVECAARRGESEEKYNAAIESLTTQLSLQSGLQSDTIRKLEMEFTNYTETLTASEDQRNLTLKEEIAKIQRDLQREQASLKTALAQRPPPGLSYEDRQRIQDTVNLASNMEKLEVRVDALQKSQEKLSHLSVSLNQRFNNLTTETLARQMMGVANKSLPKMEKSLQKVEVEIQVLRQKVDAPVNEGISAEVEKKFRGVEESLEGMGVSFQNSHDTLAKNFEDARDKISKKIESLEEFVGRQETSQSTYLETAAKNLKTFETRLDNLNTQVDDIDCRIEETRTRELFPRRDRKKMSIDAEGLPSSNGSSGQPKLGSHPVTQKNKAHAARSDSNSGTPVSRVVQDSEDEEDNDGQEATRQAMLKAFTKPPPQQQAANSSSRQSPRKGTQPFEGSSKRKRSLSREDNNEVEFRIKGKASKEARR